MEKDAKIYVAGHLGMVGSALVRNLQSKGFSNLILRSIEELDLTRQVDVERFFEQERPEYVFLAAAKVGGIHANNTYPADFIYINLQIQNNVIHSSYTYGVKKLCFLGSSCIYPKYAPQPIKEEYLLDGKLEPTNEPYAIAKIAGIKMCQAYNRQYGTRFISVMPTNLYGYNDNFDLETSHVVPALIRKFIEAKQTHSPTVTLWGTGTPRREFLFVDDLADACVFLMEHYDDTEIINIGVGEDITINELASIIKDEVGYTGNICYDTTKPDGTPRKLLDVSKLHSLGWRATTSLREGIRKTIQWYYTVYNKRH
ncbi:MAG: GDP-L-fucose synthase [Bacteroidetes bacterium]|nr:GDP-L-fucose synthase [Bacteroidota bacterium]